MALLTGRVVYLHVYYCNNFKYLNRLLRVAYLHVYHCTNYK